MDGGVGQQAELGEDPLGVLLHGPLGDHHDRGDAGVGVALGHEGQDLPLTGRELGERVVAPSALENLGDREPRPSGKIYRLACPLREGLSQDVAKRITKAIRDEGPKSVKATIQGDEVRVTSKSRDDLQTAIALLKNLDVDAALQFVNYR